MKSVKMITTELDHIIVKVLKQFFQTSKIRCTWFYYIEEISKYWIDLELPFDEELHEVGQLLKCAWAIPLALEHGKSIGMTFEKVMTAIERYVNIEEYPNTVVFKEKLKLSWASRISFICPFSTSKVNDVLEACENRMMGRLHKKNTVDILDAINKNIQLMKKNKKIKRLFTTLDKTTIISCGYKLLMNTCSEIQIFLYECSTDEAKRVLYHKVQVGLPCDYEATAEIHDLEDHPDCEQNNNTTIRFRRDHYEGPVGGPEKRRRRNKNLDDVIYSVVAASPYFEMSERTC
ncbi:uncharacterized protein LOC122857629 [Aphidius gifuensis]|uniref:uncharacterized protein LOC122857629 n=1 Tax=Aphidius gifuensis TaxID=684658 RepID=UPI001CDBE192|nr:uncharacterized protein LOC122857629 [Aphidius gifuensis]